MFARLTTGPTWTNLTFAKRWDGTSWVDVSFVRRWDGAAWITVWPSTTTLLVFTDKSEVLGTYTCTYNGIGDNTCPVAQIVTSEPVTVSTSGGVGAGPTYLWEYVSGSTGISVSNASAATVTFSAPVTRRRGVSAVWRCTVTQGLDTQIVDVTVALDYNYSVDGEVLP